MRILIQRVNKASVSVDGESVGSIGRGMLVFLGVKNGDTKAEADFLAKKCLGLRIFSDSDGKMNLGLGDVHGQLLVVSQFTLYGDARKGCRPSYIEAAPQPASEPLYEYFIQRLKDAGADVQAGKFGADMAVELINDGPVTIIIDKDKQA